MKLWSIQILRFVAALLVVYAHASERTFDFTHAVWLPYKVSLAAGRVGVDVFFVISGFIITRTAKGLSADQFIGHRARRILPLWFALSAVWMFLTRIRGGGVTWREQVATWLLWPATDKMAIPINEVGWTLCFEVLFYGAFALVIWRRQLVWPILAIFLGALLLRAPVPVFQFIGNPIILLFLAGVGLAYAPPWRAAVLGIPAGIVIIVASLILSHEPTMCPVVDNLTGRPGCLPLVGFGVPAILIVWGVLQMQAKPGLFTYLGDASYALYLVHGPIVLIAAAFGAHVLHLPSVGVLSLAMGAGVVACWPVHEFVEKPIMAAFRRKPAPQASA